MSNRATHLDIGLIDPRTRNSGDDDDANICRKCRKAQGKKLQHKHPPFFIVFISIFELVAFVYYAMLSEEPLTLIGPVPFNSRIIYNPYRRYEIWRYLTYMLIHAGYWHITFNLVIQLAVGVPLEIVHGFNPISIVYFGGIIGGAVGNSIADPYSYLAGASSGCYALIAAHLSNLIINWKEIKNPFIKLVTLLTFCFADFGTAIYERHFANPDRMAYKVSYGGHLAGALSGLLLGIVFLRNARVHHWEEIVKRVAAIIYAVLVILAIAFNTLNRNYFPFPDTREIIWTQSPYFRERE